MQSCHVQTETASHHVHQHHGTISLCPAHDFKCVQVKSIAEMGAYVALLEYNGIEGMILLSELSRRRIRSITKLIKVWAILHSRPLAVLPVRSWNNLDVIPYVGIYCCWEMRMKSIHEDMKYACEACFATELQV